MVEMEPSSKKSPTPFVLREWLVPPIVIPILMVIGTLLAALTNR